jgi:hypothetical protein
LRTWDCRPNETQYQNYNILQYTKDDGAIHIPDGSIYSITNAAASNTSSIIVMDRNVRMPGDSAKRFRRLVRNDYISLYGVYDDRNNTVRKVLSVANTNTTAGIGGDTDTIVVTPMLTGTNQSFRIQGYVDFEPVRQVKAQFASIGGKGSIHVYDGSRLFTGVKSGDTVQLLNTGDSLRWGNIGYYTADSSGHYRIAGDSGVTTINLKTTLTRNADSHGIVRIVDGGSWTLGWPYYMFMRDKINIIKQRHANDCTGNGGVRVYGAGGPYVKT